PAGAGWATVRPHAVLMNGGAVHPRLQRRGVYRALVSARLGLAREVGAAGLGVQARPDTSGPILSRFGFRTVGRWRLHAESTSCPRAQQAVGSATMQARVGIDTGGTFTDLVSLDGTGKTTRLKVPSTPADPAEALIEGLRRLVGLVPDTSP